VWLQQESILFGILKVSQACLELAAGGSAGREAVGGGQCAGSWEGSGCCAGGPVGRPAAWGWWPAYSCSALWGGEDFRRLGFQGAKVSALPCALPQPRVSPASQQSP
jgi:hypothetical protein